MSSGEQKSELLAMQGSDIAQRIRAFDWSTTPLGPAQQWPQSLRTVVDILLSSRYQMWMGWGPEITFLYNDAYRPTLGIKHPDALGKPASVVWAEIWGDIGPRIKTVLSTGQATYDEGLLLLLERSGFSEETYHTFSYSPLRDEASRICGMLCVVTEETERVIGERRLETLRDLGSALGAANTEEEVLHILRNVLSRNDKDLTFTLTYLFDEDGSARLGAWSGISQDHPLAVQRIAAGSGVPWPAHQISLHPVAGLMDSPSNNSKAHRYPPDSGASRSSKLRWSRCGSKARISRPDSSSPARIHTGPTMPLTAGLSICFADRLRPR